MIAVIGTGNMGQALVKGFVNGGVHEPKDIKVFDTLPEKAQELAESTGCVFCENIEEALKGADAILLAVKPQTMEKAVGAAVEYIGNDALVISIAAGKPIAAIRGYLGGRKRPFCRVMPNTPALIGQGASALCFEDATDEQKEYCVKLFEACGKAVVVSEDLMDAVTAVSGSGPAYGMIFVDEMAKTGAELGLDPKDALLLAAMTLRGAASLIMESGEDPEVLTKRVCSPGGTTIAAVNSLEADGFRQTIRRAVIAAAERSKELAK